MEVADRILRPFRHQAPVDAMRVDDDPALGRLPEHFRQPHHRHGARGDDIGEHLAGTDGRQLVHVADKDQRRMVRHRLQESEHQWGIDHRGLVDDEQVAFQRVILLPPKAAMYGIKSRWIVFASQPVLSTAVSPRGR
jgi:hypothetical protein